jgi:hypothetical protein
LSFAQFQQDELGRAKETRNTSPSEHREWDAETIEHDRGKGKSKKGNKQRPNGAYKFEIAVPNSMPHAEVRQITDKYLDQIGPQTFAVCAIHTDTGHKHVHVLIYAREREDTKLHFPKKVTDKERERLEREGKEVPVAFTTLDEKWARVLADHLGDPRIYTEHKRKKEETKEWKRNSAFAKQY